MCIRDSIAADVPTVAEEPDLPTGNVPVVPARSKLREQGVGTRVRTRTNVSTGFVPLVRDSKSTPKNPTLSDLNRETMQRAAEAEAAAVAEAENAAEAETVATAEAASASTAGRKYRTETTRTGHTHAVADPNAPLSSLAASPEAAERAAAREDAVEDTPRFLKLRATLIALTVPLTVLMIAIRAVASAPVSYTHLVRRAWSSSSALVRRMAGRSAPHIPRCVSWVMDLAFFSSDRCLSELRVSVLSASFSYAKNLPHEFAEGSLHSGV